MWLRSSSGIRFHFFPPTSWHCGPATLLQARPALYYLCTWVFVYAVPFACSDLPRHLPFLSFITSCLTFRMQFPSRGFPGPLLLWVWVWCFLKGLLSRSEPLSGCSAHPVVSGATCVRSSQLALAPTDSHWLVRAKPGPPFPAPSPGLHMDSSHWLSGVLYTMGIRTSGRFCSWLLREPVLSHLPL